MKIIIDGQEIWVPEGNVTGKALRQRAGASSEDTVLYRITPEGHQVIHDGDIVEVGEGERFGTMERVIAG